MENIKSNYPKSAESKGETSVQLWCPYCLAEIPSEAEVCRYCGRDVGRLIRAEIRIKELEAQTVDNERQTEVSTSGRLSVFRILLWSFYLASTLSVIVLELPGRHHEYVIMVLGIATGIMVMRFGKQRNIWVLFLLGLAQPLITSIALLLLGMASLRELGGMLDRFLLVSIQVGASMALGGLATALILTVSRRRKLVAEQFSLTVLFDWVATAESRLDRVEKFLLRMAPVALVIIQLITSIVALLNKR